MHLVAGIDPLRRITDFEIDAAFQAGLLLQNGYADLFRNAGIDRGLEHHHAALLQVAAQSPARALHGGQVGRMVVVDRSGHRHDMKLRLPKLRLVCGELHGGIPDHFVPHFPGGIHSGTIQLYLLFVQIVAHHLDLSGEGHGDGHAHIAESHQGQLFFSRHKFLI